MADIEFEVAKRESKTITFSLRGDDHVYSFKAPKNAVMLVPILEAPRGEQVSDIAMTKSTFDWLGAGLSESDNDRIKARLNDPEDDLDTDTLGNIVEGLTSAVSGRPTS